MTAAKTLLTEAEFALLEEPEGGHYELDEGEVVFVASGTYEHMLVRDELLADFKFAIRAKPSGVVGAEIDIRFGPHLVRRPALHFFSTEKARSIDYRRVPVDVIPDLVAEIISTHDKANEVYRERQQYLAAGCREVWLVWLEAREVEVWRGGKGRIVSGDAELTCPDLLPGFSLRVRDLFAVLDRGA